MEILSRCRQRLSATALMMEGCRYSYGALLRAADALAGEISPRAQKRRGNDHGPRVAVYASPGPEYVASTWAAWQAGAIVVRQCPFLAPYLAS